MQSYQWSIETPTSRLIGPSSSSLSLEVYAKATDEMGLSSLAHGGVAFETVWALGEAGEQRTQIP